MKNIIVEIPLSSLPNSCRITGRALIIDGYEYEPQGAVAVANEKKKVVLRFEDERLGSIRRKLRGRRCDEIKLRAIRFIKR